MHILYTLCSVLIRTQKDIVETKEQKENKAFSSEVFHSFLQLCGEKQQ